MLKKKKNIINNFLELYDLKNLVKDKTCFKSLQNPKCIDLFLTNCNRSFLCTKAISTGLSDFHKMIITVLKTTFTKGKPKEIIYRSFKNYDREIFSQHLEQKFIHCENYTQMDEHFLVLLNEHAPLKKKIVRANEVPYMTRDLRKAIANRSRLENRFYRSKTDESKIAYKKQKNYCSRLYKNERKTFYAYLDTKKNH